MPEGTMLWNMLLSLAAAGIIWWVRGVTTRIESITKLVNVTREEMARYYALKEDVDKDMQKLLNRFDRLEEKLDKLFERLVK